MNAGTLAMLIGTSRRGLERQLTAPWVPPRNKGKKRGAESEEETEIDDLEETGNEGQPGSSSRNDAVNVRPRPKCVLITREEESLRKRRTLARGIASLSQMEHMWMIPGGGPLNLPERACAYGGTNRGTIIGPVKTPSIESEWKLTVKDTGSAKPHNDKLNDHFLIVEVSVGVPGDQKNH